MKLKEKIVNRKNNKDEVVIELSSISKRYFIHHDKPTLIEDFIRFLSSKNKEEFWSLTDLDLKIRKGEKIGVYGPNGAGKTTLLKLIAGISSPTKGKIKTKGRIVSLIDLGAGFYPDLSGRENIFINGLLIGMSREEILEKLDQIIEFSGLGKFITAPLYTYSRGMQLRLGFSIAVFAKPDVLLLDEIIDAGDKEFRNKSFRVLREMFKSELTIVTVSHYMGFLERISDRIIFLEKKI